MKLFYLICFSFFLKIILGLPIILITTKNLKDQIIYSDSILNSNYDYNSNEKYSCNWPNVQEEDSDNNSRTFKIKLDPNSLISQIKLLSVESHSSNSVVDVSIDKNNFPLIITKLADFETSISYKCHEENEKWSIITVNFEFENNNRIALSYLKICNNETNFIFDYSTLILAILTIIFLIGTRNKKITSFQRNFFGILIDFPFTLIFVLVCSFCLITLNYFWNVCIIIYIILVCFLVLISVTNILLDFIGFLPDFLQCKIGIIVPNLGKVNLNTIFSIIIGLGLSISWAITRNFILTDVSALFIIIFSFKIFKINSMRNGTIFMLIEMIFELIWAFIFNYAFDYQYDRFFSSDFCLPLKLEIPTMNYFLHKKCSWVSITSIIFPGLFLSYLNRYDLSKNVNLYFITGLIGYSIGVLIWLILTWCISYSTPISFYSVICLLCCVLIVGYTRNEHGELWKGFFYDVEMSQIIENENEIEQKDSLYKKDVLFDGLLSKEGSKDSGHFENIIDGKIGSINSKDVEK